MPDASFTISNGPVTVFRQRGFHCGRFGRPHEDYERAAKEKGPEVLAAFQAGLRVGRRERARALEAREG